MKNVNRNNGLMPRLLVGLASLAVLILAAFGVNAALRQTPFEFPSDLATLDIRSIGGVTEHEIANGVQWAGGGRKILWEIQDKNPSTGVWESTTFTYSTPYDLTSVAPRLGGHVLFIAGAHANGDAVVERWVFPAITGGYQVDAQPPETPIGEPRGPFTASITLEGGSYIPHSSRFRAAQGGGGSFFFQPIPQKTELYRGSEFGLFDCTAVDPEGRFLLLHSYDVGTLCWIDLTDPPFTVQILYSVATIPHLADVTSIRLLDHWILDHRFALLSESKGGGIPLGAKHTVLFDYDNDGQFDGFQTFSTNEWSASSFANSFQWRSPYRLD